MRKIAAILLLLSLIAGPVYAINLLETIVYRKDIIKAYNATILVNPLTHEIKYLWYRTSETTGHWEPIAGFMKAQFQDLYNQERNAR